MHLPQPPQHRCATCERVIVSSERQCPHCLLHRARLGAVIDVLGRFVNVLQFAVAIPIPVLRPPPPPPALPYLSPLLQNLLQPRLPAARTEQDLLDNARVRLLVLHRQADAYAQHLAGAIPELPMVPPLDAPNGMPEVLWHVMEAKHLLFRMAELAAEPDRQKDLPNARAGLEGLLDRIKIELRRLQSALAALA